MWGVDDGDGGEVGDDGVVVWGGWGEGGFGWGGGVGEGEGYFCWGEVGGGVGGEVEGEV